MSIETRPEHGLVDKHDGVVRQIDRTGDHDTGFLESQSREGVSRRLAMIGRGTIAAVIYGVCLYAAAMVVGELASLLPGFAGVVLLFTVGIAVIGVAPSVAQWMVTWSFESPL
jgi:hypothetical protein